MMHMRKQHATSDLLLLILYGSVCVLSKWENESSFFTNQKNFEENILNYDNIS